MKYLLLSLITVAALNGCKEGSDMADIYKIPVIIKFDIPDSSIVDDPINLDKENQVHDKIVEKYPGIHEVNLVHYRNIRSTIDYYEYIGRVGDTVVHIFIFKSPNGIAIKGIKCEGIPEKETRYELDSHGLEVYKRFFEGKSTVTLSIFCQTKAMLISFCRDDGFSEW